MSNTMKMLLFFVLVKLNVKQKSAQRFQLRRFEASLKLIVTH